MVLFESTAPLIFDINLIVQLILLVLVLIGGYVMGFRRIRRNHGAIMATATILNLIMVFLVMGPSLIIHLGVIVTSPTNPGVIITLAHVSIGLIAIIGGIVFSGRFLKAVRNSEPLVCGKRNQMRMLLTFWLLGLFLGLGFYLYYYLPA